MWGRDHIKVKYTPLGIKHVKLTCRPESNSELDTEPDHDNYLETEQDLPRLNLMLLDRREHGEGDTHEHEAEHEHVIQDLISTVWSLQKVISFRLYFPKRNMLPRLSNKQSITHEMCQE